MTFIRGYLKPRIAAPRAFSPVRCIIGFYNALALHKIVDCIKKRHGVQ
jgi:hypothetical protein